MSLRGIVLDGVTGAGKTSVLDALKGHPDISGFLKEGKIYDEEATLGGALFSGDVMDELADSSMSDAIRWRRLEAILSDIELSRTTNAQSGLFVVERFHLTYYVLMPDKELLSSYDSRLASLNAGIVLLTFPDAEMSTRALHRPDRADSKWLQEMVGERDESIVLDELRTASVKYQEAVAMSKLPTLVLDTSAKDWATYAHRIGEFIRRV